MGRVVEAKVFLRSFFIQSSWNFEGMQAMGFLWALEPVLDERYGDSGEERAKAARRYLDPLNTHPFFAPALLGIAVNLERRGEGARAAAIMKSAMGPFGGTGDSFFWGGVKPFLCLIAVMALFFGFTAAPAALVALWLAFTVAFRWYAFSLGCERGEEGAKALLSKGFLRMTRWLKGAAACLAAIFVVAFAVKTFPAHSKMPLYSLGASAFVLFVAYAGKRRINPILILYAASLVAALIWMR